MPVEYPHAVDLFLSDNIPKTELPLLVSPYSPDYELESDVSSTASSMVFDQDCSMEHCCYGGGHGIGQYYECSKCANLYVCINCYSGGGHKRHRKYMYLNEDYADD